MDSDDEEEHFPMAELDDPAWPEEAIPDRQQLCIYQKPPHTPRSAIPSPQPIQEAYTEPDPMDIEILDDLPDVIDVLNELSSDSDSWELSMLKYQW